MDEKGFEEKSVTDPNERKKKQSEAWHWFVIYFRDIIYFDITQKRFKVQLFCTVMLKTYCDLI